MVAAAFPVFQIYTVSILFYLPLFQLSENLLSLAIVVMSFYSWSQSLHRQNFQKRNGRQHFDENSSGPMFETQTPRYLRGWFAIDFGSTVPWCRWEKNGGHLSELTWGFGDDFFLEILFRCDV